MPEESKKTALVMTGASTLVAVVVTGIVGWATGVWNQGSEAIARDQIEAIAKEVVAAEMKTDTGMTQAQALGMTDAQRIFVDHPIQDATDDEMRAKAEAIVDQVIDALSS